jgi:hypothetical protein
MGIADLALAAGRQNCTGAPVYDGRLPVDVINRFKQLSDADRKNQVITCCAWVQNDFF